MSAGRSASAGATPSRRWLWWFGAMLGLALLALGVVRWLARAPLLEVVAATHADVARMLAVTGRVEATRAVNIAPQYTGRLTELVHREGDAVRAGDLLARLEDTSAKSAVKQQRAALAARRSDVAQARREVARSERLLAEGALDATTVEQQRQSLIRAEADVAQLAAALQQGQAQLTMTAPFDGTIVRRLAEIGQVVGPQSAVFEIATTGETRVTAEVDERYVRALRPGLRAEVMVAGAGSAPVPAEIGYVAQVVDAQTGAATVRFSFDTPLRDALLGLSVDVNVHVADLPGMLVIPRSAIGTLGGVPFVLVVEADRVVRRAITLDDWPATRVVVTGGLHAGELIAADPTAATDGARVRTHVVPHAL